MTTDQLTQTPMTCLGAAVNVPLFDLPRFEQTEEGVIVELTYQGPRLAQVELHPSVVVDRSQANLLNPSQDGRVVVGRMKAASDRLR